MEDLGHGDSHHLVVGDNAIDMDLSCTPEDVVRIKKLSLTDSLWQIQRAFKILSSTLSPYMLFLDSIARPCRQTEMINPWLTSL